MVLHLLEQMRTPPAIDGIKQEGYLIGHQEWEGLLTALSRASWSRTEASRMLGVDRTTLWRRMKKHNINAPPEKHRPVFQSFPGTIHEKNGEPECGSPFVQK